MNPIDLGRATAPAIHDLPSKFMLDGATYVRGAELGFEGMDFYAAGRGGVLGDVTADVVAAAFVFFEPGLVPRRVEPVGEGGRPARCRRRVR